MAVRHLRPCLPEGVAVSVTGTSFQRKWCMTLACVMPGMTNERRFGGHAAVGTCSGGSALAGYALAELHMLLTYLVLLYC